MTIEFDVIIIGSGLAGLTIALQIADTKKVCLVSKREISDSASSWAQGGIAAVLNTEVNNDDSIDHHIQDTLIAGAGLCDTAITRLVATKGREAVEWLIDQGVEFTREADNSALHLTREGGHSQRRIVHVADATGRAVQKTLAQKVREHANITILENHIAVDLITNKKINQKSLKNNCLGAYVLDNTSGKVITIAAQKTVLATGGALPASRASTAAGRPLPVAGGGSRKGRSLHAQQGPQALAFT